MEMGKRKRSGSFSKTDESGAKKSDDCGEDSQEELDLENASSFNKNTNNATRCSARVQEKQEKLRRESSPSKQILPLEINCASTPSGSYSTSTSKGNAKHPSPSIEDSCAINDLGSNISNSVGLEEKRKKRNWELWSVEDKQLFFEALNEFGKDFDAIQNYLATKLKPKSKAIICGQYAAKNKDQVRHFYYRTWNKISKHLRFPSEMKKANQELYGLVNYGELRKKQRVLNSKSAAKLSELVENGITSIKFRGKTCRIKTPVCRCLKRLNGLDDIEHTRVPNKVSLEFVPRDCKTWRSVQGLSHNPRVKVFVNLQRTLASVVSFFESKWKRQEDRLKEQFGSVFGKPRAQLRAIPVQDARELNIPLYRVAENTSSATICLRSYTQNMLRERHGEASIPNIKIKRKRKQSGGGSTSQNGCLNIDPNFNLLPVKRPSDALDYCPADAENSDVDSQYALFGYTSSEKTSTQTQSHHHHHHHHPDTDFGFPDEQSKEMAWMRFQQKWLDLDEEEPQQDNMNSILFGITENNPSTSEINNMATETDNDDLDQDHETEEMEVADKLCACGSGKVAQSENFVSHVWDDERAKRGWTAEEAGVMTVGEIYLMLGQTEKICFEYTWDTQDEDTENARNYRLMERLINTARMLKRKKSTRSKATPSMSMSTSCSCICATCGIKMENPLNPSCSSIQNQKIPPGVPVPQTVAIQNQNDQPQPQPQIKFQLTGSPTLGLGSSVLPDVSPSCLVNTNPTQNPTLGASAVVQNSPTAFLQYFATPEISLKSPAGVAVANTITLNQAEPSKDGLLAGNSCIISQNTDIPPSGLIELCSIATKSGQDNSPVNRHVAPNIKATMLAASSSIVKAPNGSISISYANVKTKDNPINQGASPEDISSEMVSKHSHTVSIQKNSPSSVTSKEQMTFHRPTLRNLEPALPATGEIKGFPPPKPFLDLPKGNRRLGRRPNYKRVVIPRVLPLLPKPTIASCIPTVTVSTSNTLIGHTVTLLPNTPSIIAIDLRNDTNTNTNTSTSTPANQPSSSTSICHTQPMPTPTPTPKPTANPTSVETARSDFTPNTKNTSSTSSSSSSKMFTEAFLGSVGGPISCSSNDFEDLLKVRRHESNISNVSAGDMDNLSLSSFMEISLPESARIAANEINNDLKIEDLDNSNCSVNLSNLMNSSGAKLTSALKDLSTPESTPRKPLPFSNTTGTSEGLSLPSLSSFENPWTLESGDMSLSNIFGQFDAPRGNAVLPEGDVNFQTMMTEGLDFGMKLELTSSEMSDNRK